MNPWLIRLIALGITYMIGKEAFKSKRKFEITKNSNCDDLFKRFNQVITIHPNKVASLRKAHNTIRTKVSNYFEKYTNLPIPDFYIQGSYKMKTIVENRSTICDVDLGVFFSEHPRLNVETIQNHIKNAITGHTTRGVTIKTNCVRLNYVRDFHIDLPIYYIDKFSGETYFGARGYKWERSEPKAFIDWFNAATKNKPQLIRIIRYLKAWGDNAKTKTGKKFPSGLALTLWAVQFFEKSNRDDVAFFNTGTAIMKFLHNKRSWNAMMPVPPGDDVMNRLNSSQKSSFYNEIEEMVSMAADAVSAKNRSEAISIWNKIFGRRFRGMDQ
ncbi:MAG: CBASS cGAMP synthase [Fulvivirga sp.]